MPPGSGFEFINELKGQEVPREYVPSIEKGVIEAMRSGVIAGYPMVDIKVSVYDGSHHPVDSSELAFKIAASQAFTAGARKCNPQLLEPLMAVEITTPSDYLGEVVGGLQQRRAKIGLISAKGGLQIIQANVPLAEMFGYATRLRSLTQGRATYTMQFSHYARVPQEISDMITGKKFIQEM